MAASRTILVIARGALGHDVARALDARGEGLRAVVVSTVPEAAAGARCIDAASPSCQADLAAVLDDVEPDSVALLALSESARTPAQPWNHDAALVGAVTSALAQRAASAPDVLLLTSTAVYGVARFSPVVFDERTVPPRAAESASDQERWAEGHREAERRVVAWAVAAGAGVGVVRTASVLGGPLDSPLAGLLGATLPVRVLGYDPPCQAIHYDDLVAGLALAIAKRCGEVVNLVGPGVAPLSRVLATAGILATPLPGPVADRMAPATMDGDSLRWRTLADGRRAAELLGFRPRRNLEDCLRARR